jgi:Tol biopolymer transport system component
MCGRTRVTLSAVAFVALILTCAALATTPGKSGQIVFAKETAPDHFQLFTISADGTGEKQITHAFSALNPDWSPNGNSLVAQVETANSARVATMDADGKHMRVLTPKGFQGQPSFSPDGKSIVYERDLAEAAGHDNGVWLMRADGTGNRRLTRNPFPGSECGCDTDPNFSPSGQLITFVRIKEDERSQALFAIRPNGTGLRQLTPYSWEVAIKHDWSPDGKLIVLTTNGDFVHPSDSANMVTIHPDGTGRTSVTKFRRGVMNAFAGSFSPDGKQIVFRLESGNSYSIAIVNRDGSNLHRLTTDPTPPRFIDWGTHR